MSIRMTGLTSGLDTDTVVQALMSAQRMKLTKVENKKQKLEWKQDLWSSVNSKVYKFYSGTLSSARLQTTYNTKKATSSDSSKVSVTASSTASEGTYKVKVNQLASAQYVTSAKVSTTEGDDVSTSTKLTDMGVSDGTQITITGADKSYVLTVDENTTVSDFVTACQNAGLTASFDTTQQRFFISSSTSGADQSFTITASTMSEDQSNAIQAWKDAIGYDYLSSSDQTKVTKIFSDLQLGNITEDEAMDELESYLETAKANATSSYYSNLLTETVTASVNAEYEDYYTYDQETGEITGLSDAGKEYYEEVMAAQAEESEETGETGETEPAGDESGEEEEEVTGPTDEEMLAAVQSWQSAAISDGIAEAKASVEYVTAVENAATTGIEGQEGFLGRSVSDDQTTLEGIVYGTADASGNYSGGYKDVMTASDEGEADLSGLGLAQVTGDTVLETEESGNGMAVIAATDASVTVNGATLTSSDNTITMNGLTMDLVDVTDSEVTITVSKDTSAVYDTIKDFINEYNELLTMLNGYYYADSARDYEVLTDDEKAAMSDDEIEKWENKIKDSLLRNDDYVNTIINTMKNCMMATYTASDGNTYSLASLGITTSSDYTEKGLLHIQGDADDSEYADYDNKLEAMIESDPDLVAEIMTGLTGALYDQMYEISKSSTYSSVYTFYNDKEMESQLSDYKKEISDWETKLANLEDRYYSQFTAMETALAKLNSQSTYINALLSS